MSIQHEAFEAAGPGVGGAIGVEDDPAVVVKARGYWEQVWLRFKQDRIAIVGGVFIIVLVLASLRARRAPDRPAALGRPFDD